MKYRVIQDDFTGIAIRVFGDRGEWVGGLDAYAARKDGVEYLMVRDVRVNAAWHRRGIGTRLYEIAAESACRRGVGLASSYAYARSAMSTGFWKKQQRIGRAVLMHERMPDSAFFVLKDPCGGDLGLFA